MLNALIQTVANLGFDASAITKALINVFETIQNGDLSSMQGIGDLFSGLISAVTGISSGDISALFPALLDAITAMLSDFSI